jgi:hypothetical protein
LKAELLHAGARVRVPNDRWARKDERAECGSPVRSLDKLDSYAA